MTCEQPHFWDKSSWNEITIEVHASSCPHTTCNEVSFTNNGHWKNPSVYISEWIFKSVCVWVYVYNRIELSQ